MNGGWDGVGWHGLGVRWDEWCGGRMGDGGMGGWEDWLMRCVSEGMVIDIVLSQEDNGGGTCVLEVGWRISMGTRQRVRERELHAGWGYGRVGSDWYVELWPSRIGDWGECVFGWIEMGCRKGELSDSSE